MIRKLIILFFLVLPSLIWAEDISIGLEKAPINSHDIASIKRGATFFANVCMACHTLIYLRYDPIAKAAGITLDKMPINVTQWPLNKKPPDLSLEADYRGVDWIYTYLHSFYQDPTRPTGVNNILLPNTAMAGILVPYQGQLIKVEPQKIILGKTLQWYDVLVLQQQGTMTQAQYDQTITDVVNFLNYAANPYENKQQRIGLWVIGFLIILFILMWLLKRDYWKDIGKHKKN